jgi:rubrerythrin
MNFDFSADEVFEMAEQLEKNGADFYRNSAANITDEANRKVLLGLAAMEDKHGKIFAEMRASLTSRDKESSTFDPEEETMAYLKALVDTRVFFKKEIDTSSMKEILKAALVAEKDAIVFFMGLKDMVPENLGKNRLEDIIKEEMSHIKLIGNMLAKTGA